MTYRRGFPVLLLNLVVIPPAFRTTEADDYDIEQGEIKGKELSKQLSNVYLRRAKEDELADDLPKKDERIVFCEPSQLQKEMYRYILELPDFTLVSECNGPCECGVNQKVRQGSSSSLLRFSVL